MTQIQLPHLESATVAQRVVALAPNQPTYRILVVDDVPELRLLLTQTLSAVGFEVQDAENGEVAIAHWQSWKPQVILMDWQMPVMGGDEATRWIRAAVSTSGSEPSAPDPIIIAVSASAFESDRATILQSGCHDWIQKPFTVQTLFAKLGQHLGVEYRYETQTKPGGTATPSQDSLTEVTDETLNLSYQSLARLMPVNWLQQLEAAAISLDADSCLTLLKQMPEPQTRETLIALVTDFRFDLLLDLTRPPTPLKSH